MTAALVDAFGMDRDKIDFMGMQAYPGEGPHWITEEEATLDEPAVQKLLGELEQDPDIQAILAVADLAITASSKDYSA